MTSTDNHRSPLSSVVQPAASAADAAASLGDAAAELAPGAPASGASELGAELDALDVALDGFRARLARADAEGRAAR